MTMFSGLYTALKGLQASQRAMEVTGHNVANANTEGYSRQQAVLVASDVIEVGGLKMGTGVEVEKVRRIRDAFLDMQIRSVNSKSGYWQSKQDVLQQVEVTYMEPSEKGIASLLNNFWNSWQEVSLNPESSSVRVDLTENAASLADAINSTYSDLLALRTDINRTLETTVSQVNTISDRIAQLNEQINEGMLRNQPPNDLMDKRDLLLKDLAEIADIKAFGTADGMMDVFLGGRPLVAGSSSNKMELVVNNNDPIVKWETGPEVELNAGRVKALLDVTQEIKDDYLANLDELALRLTEEVNKLHETGYGLDNSTGIKFFTDLSGSSMPAAAFKVNDDLIDDPNKIAAAGQTDSPGDNSNVAQIVALKDLPLTHPDNNGDYTATFNSFYTDSIARLGVKTQQANHMVDNSRAMLDQVVRRQESAAGANLDEEMANMVQFQHSYSAAAKISATIDQMLETLLNNVG